MDKSLYGRRWQLQILHDDGVLMTVGQNGFTGQESLKCTFEVNYPGYEGWYFSEFVIWNPSNEFAKKIIEEGNEVYFSAGYSEGRYRRIFSGKIFQALWTRENVTDYKLTLWCMDGERLFRDNFSAFTIAKGYRDQTLINMIASRAVSPLKVGVISSGIRDIAMPRAATIFAQPSTPLREVVRTNSAQMFMSEDTLQIAKVTDEPDGDAIDINPQSGLIGTPQQIDYGITFRVLLNPDLIIANPPKWVRLDLSEINVKQQKATPGQNIVPPLPKDGFFQVGGVKHSGDTRGNEWYTDVIGYSKTGKQPVGPIMVPGFLTTIKDDPNT